MNINFAEVGGTINEFPMLNLSFKFSEWVEAFYFNENQFPYFLP